MTGIWDGRVDSDRGKSEFPFDFAQGDDNKKGNDSGKSQSVEADFVSSIPPIANSEMDGAPEPLWLSLG
jgi:hypothetical protein